MNEALRILYSQTQRRSGTSEQILTFETIIRDVIDTFRNTAQAVNQEFVQKSQIETSSCQRSHT